MTVQTVSISIMNPFFQVWLPCRINGSKWLMQMTHPQENITHSCFWSITGKCALCDRYYIERIRSWLPLPYGYTIVITSALRRISFRPGDGWYCNPYEDMWISIYQPKIIRWLEFYYFKLLSHDIYGIWCQYLSMQI